MSLDTKPKINGGLLEGNQLYLSKNEKKISRNYIIQRVKHYENGSTDYHISLVFSHFFLVKNPTAHKALPT